MIPFVISEAHPDYKRPYLSQDFGMVKEEEMHTYFLDRVCTFILDRKHIDELTNVVDVERFFHNYYDEYYMDNSPWSAMVFQDNDWNNANPSYESIWEHIQLIKLEEQESESEDFSKNEDVSIDWNLDDQEKIDEIATKMRDYFGQLLKEDPLPSDFIDEFKNMNHIEQMVYLLNRPTSFTYDKYKENTQLLCDFMNLCIKCLQKDIEDVTNQLQVEHSDEMSEKLQQMMTLYSNCMLLKQTFDI